VIRKAKAVGVGGMASAVEEVRSLLAEERDGGMWTVEVVRKVPGNSIPVNCFVMLLSVVSPLFLSIVGLSCGVFYHAFGVFIHVSCWIFIALSWRFIHVFSFLFCTLWSIDS